MKQSLLSEGGRDGESFFRFRFRLKTRQQRRRQENKKNQIDAKSWTILVISGAVRQHFFFSGTLLVLSIYFPPMWCVYGNYSWFHVSLLLAAADAERAPRPPSYSLGKRTLPDGLEIPNVLVYHKYGLRCCQKGSNDNTIYSRTACVLHNRVTHDTTPQWWPRRGNLSRFERETVTPLDPGTTTPMNSVGYRSE